ncbi:hypothetical protein SUGI_0019820 [Cryptomeria japonica]|nr:hypothetical protein SUGI_0019820 [Cryptomeria japonica]
MRSVQGRAKEMIIREDHFMKEMKRFMVVLFFILAALLTCAIRYSMAQSVIIPNGPEEALKLLQMAPARAPYINGGSPAQSPHNTDKDGRP